jgi:hypothetical protein
VDGKMINIRMKRAIYLIFSLPNPKSKTFYSPQEKMSIAVKGLFWYNLGYLKIERRKLWERIVKRI